MYTGNQITGLTYYDHSFNYTTRSMVYKKQLIRNICHIARKLRNKSYSARKKNKKQVCF